MKFILKTQFIVFFYPIVMASLPESWILYKKQKQKKNPTTWPRTAIELNY